VTEFDKTLLQQLSQLQAPDCPSIGALGDFLDGKVSAEEKQSLEAHLRVCPSCINRLIDLRELALLAKTGEAPPPALTTKLKRLALFLVTGEETSSSVLERTRAALSAAWTAVWEWATPRFLGEVAAATAVAVFLVFLGPTLLWQQLPSTKSEGEQIKAVTELTTQEQSVLTSLSLAPAGPDPLQKQIVSTLEKLPKNLLLEETRGVTNVEVYKKAAPATVLVVTDQRLGSGVVISSQGEMLTNWHVIEGASHIAVVFKPQRGVEVKRELAFAAIPLKVDQIADLALLQIQAPPQNLNVLSLGDITKVEVGQDVHAIGHPEGEVWTYTTGIISQIRPHYQWKGPDDLLHQSTVIQTQTALNPGNSGGPLLNDQGEIIGINSFRGEGEGLNYAVAADVVAGFLQQPASTAAAPAAPAPRPSSYRTESYGPNIVGVYIDARVPPPDVWFVYGESRAQPAYAATGRVTATDLNTVIEGGDPQWQSLVYYFDVDCDGEIDLIGDSFKGNGTIDRYRLPERPLRVADLAKELTQALQQHLIPYSQLRMCR
jgi:S1-C subfamily serine protease